MARESPNHIVRVDKCTWLKYEGQEMCENFCWFRRVGSSPCTTINSCMKPVQNRFLRRLINVSSI